MRHSGPLAATVAAMLRWTSPEVWEPDFPGKVHAERVDGKDEKVVSRRAHPGDSGYAPRRQDRDEEDSPTRRRKRRGSDLRRVGNARR